ncbi:MAG TPA: MFS transporter [Micromonosporaceae bacterium]
MAVLRRLTGAATATARDTKALVRRAATTGRRAGRYAGARLRWLRHRSAKGEIGMIRLLDLHAASCAGDSLVAIGLAGTIFFSVPVGEARSRVALYLLLTMAPFALLAPVVGPVLDRFRHGRRYALASTMLGRAFLAWVISDNLDEIALYPAAFVMLVLSRSYGVARSAAVPRLLPANLGLVEAGARASLFGTVAGALVAPLGVALFYLGPQWTLRLSSVVFLAGMVIALRLPPRADSDPPETIPRMLQLPGHRTAKVLTGRLVAVALTGSAALRTGYGFLLLFLAFRIREGDFAVPDTLAIALVAAGLGAGSLLATVLCARLTIRRPLTLQATGLVVAVLATVVATWWYSIGTVTALCLLTALASGVAKLAVDAVIQERLPEKVRASAFAHSETLLILAWVAGGGIGLIPISGQLGLAILVSVLTLAAVRVAGWAARLPDQRLSGVASHDAASAQAYATAPGPGTAHDQAAHDQAAHGRSQPDTGDMAWRQGSGPA